MKHWITISGYLAILGLTIYKAFSTDFPALLHRLLSFRSTRIAILIIWWWLGLHFLNAPQ